MRHLIAQIDTLIKNRELYVSIMLENEWEPFTIVPFTYITKAVGPISVFEIDILEDCYLKPSSFYNRGEKLQDGNTVYEDNKIPKTWKIAFDGSIEDLRERYKSKMLSFQSIYSVEVSDKNNKEPYVKIKTTDNNVYFYKLPSFKRLVGLNEDEFSILNGVFISPIMYKKGDTAEYNGRFIPINQDNKIVSTFNIRIEGTLDNHYKIYGNPQLEANRTNKMQGNFGNQNDNSYGSSYHKYNGYNGWDDDTIDNAFEGDPEATWNVD